MKIKRLAALLFSLSLIVFGLTACGDDNTPTPSPANTGTPVSTLAEARELLQTWLDNHPFSEPVTINDSLTEENDTGFNFVLYDTEEFAQVRVVKNNGALLRRNPEGHYTAIDAWYRNFDGYADSSNNIAAYANASPESATAAASEPSSTAAGSNANTSNENSSATKAQAGTFSRGNVSGTFIYTNDRAESITFADGKFEMNLKHDDFQVRVVQGTYITRGNTITISYETGLARPYNTVEIELQMDSDNDTIWFRENLPLVSAIPGNTYPSLAGSEPTERSLGFLNMPKNEWVTINGWTASIQVPFTETFAIEVVDLDPYGLDVINIPEHIQKRMVSHGLMIRHITDEGIKTTLDEADSYQEFRFDDGNIGWKLEFPSREGAIIFINGNVLFQYGRDLDRYNTFYNNTELLHAVARTLTRVPMVQVGSDPSIYIPASWQVKDSSGSFLSNNAWVNYSGNFSVYTGSETSSHIFQLTNAWDISVNYYAFPSNNSELIRLNLEHMFDGSRTRDYIIFASGDTGVSLTFPPGSDNAVYGAETVWLNNVFCLIRNTQAPLSFVAEMLVEEIVDSFSVRSRNADGDSFISLLMEGPEAAALEWQKVSTDYFAINIPTLWETADLKSDQFAGDSAWEDGALLLYGINFWNKNDPLAYKRLHDAVIRNRYGAAGLSEGLIELAVGFLDESNYYQIMKTSAVETIDFQFDDGNTGVMRVFRDSIYWQNGTAFLRYNTRFDFNEQGHSDTILAIARSLTNPNTF